jgi:hypothetical protein
VCGVERERGRFEIVGLCVDSVSGKKNTLLLASHTLHVVYLFIPPSSIYILTILGL